MKIAISRLHFPVTTLGPGNRIGIWFQGCSLKCIGCISKDTWPSNTSLVEIDEVENVIKQWIPMADGVTISGGEPFEQIEQLRHILQWIKTYSSISTLVYSGFKYSDIQQQVVDLHPWIDALISEPFDVNKPQTLPLRGSDNQQLHLLTDLGETTFGCYCHSTKESSRLNVKIEDESIWFAGIPQQDFLHTLADELAQEGHQIHHTQTRIKEP